MLQVYNFELKKNFLNKHGTIDNISIILEVSEQCVDGQKLNVP